MRVTVLILNSHWLVRRAWSFMLGSNPRFRVIAECNDLESALLRTRTLQPDLILSDSEMPAIRNIHIEPFVQMFSSQTRVISVSANCFSLFKFGVLHRQGPQHVSKSTSIYRLFHQIQELKPQLGEGCYVDGNLEYISMKKFEQAALESFTIGEVEIICGVLNHLSLKEISLACGVSQRKVKKQLTRIIRDLRLSNTSELIQYLLRTNGIFNRLAMTIENSIPGKQTHERNWGPALHWN